MVPTTPAALVEHPAPAVVIFSRRRWPDATLVLPVTCVKKVVPEVKPVEELPTSACAVPSQPCSVGYVVHPAAPVLAARSNPVIVIAAGSVQLQYCTLDVVPATGHDHAICISLRT